MSIPDTDIVSSLAYHLNPDIPSFRSLPLTRYASTPLFAEVVRLKKYERTFIAAFGNISISQGVPQAIAKMDHGTMGLESTKAAMVLIGIMIVVVGLRLYSKLWILPGRLRAEDWMMLFAAIWICAMQGLNWALMMKAGNGHHMYDLSADQVSLHLRLLYFLLLFYHVTILPIKLSLLLSCSSLYSSLPSGRISIRTFRIGCYGLAALLVVGDVAFFLGGMMTCMPIDFWNHLSTVTRDCGNIYLRQDALNIFSLITDAILLGAGVFLVWRMGRRFGWGDVCGLVVLFSLGVVICASTIVRIFAARRYETSPDFTRYGAQLAFLFVLEPALAVIAISLPAARTLIVHVLDAHSSASNHMSSSYTGDSNTTSTPRTSKRRWSWKWRGSDEVNVNEVDVEAEAPSTPTEKERPRWKGKMKGMTEMGRIWFRPQRHKTQNVEAQGERTGSSKGEELKINTTDTNPLPPIDDKEGEPLSSDLDGGISPRSGGNLSKKYDDDVGSSSYYFPYTRRSASTDANAHSSSNPLYGGPPGPPPKVPLPDIPTRPLTPSTASSIACDYEIERQRSNEAATYSMYQYSSPALGIGSSSRDDIDRGHPTFRFSEPLPAHMDDGSGTRDNLQERILRFEQQRSMSVPDSQAELRRLGSSSELKGLSPRPPPRK